MITVIANKLKAIRRMKTDLIEMFKMISGFPDYGRHFLIFLIELKIYCQDALKNNVYSPI